MGQRRNSLGAFSNLCADQAGKSLPRPNLKKSVLAIGDDTGDTVCKVHRPAQMPDPIIRIFGFFGPDPRTRKIREKRDPRRTERDSTQVLPKFFENWIHHRRVKSV